MKEERERNIYRYVCFASIASVISLMLSLVVTIRYNYRTNLEIDYLGAIVAIVSLVVAVFVGVQIYHSFNLKRDIDEQNRKLLANAEKSFLDKISTLQNELTGFKNEADRKYGDCKLHIDNEVNSLKQRQDDLGNQINQVKTELLNEIKEQIQREKKISFLHSIYQQALGVFDKNEGWRSFYSFCYIACQAHDFNIKALMEQSIQRAKEVKDKFEDLLKEKMKRDVSLYESLVNDLRNTDMNEAKELVMFIEDVINSSLQK